MSMIRQCAWCLRLIDDDGERISRYPLPKIYEATHGMCCMCGILWVEQATKDQEIEVVGPREEGQDFDTPAHLPIVEIESAEVRPALARRLVKLLNP